MILNFLPCINFSSTVYQHSPFWGGHFLLLTHSNNYSKMNCHRKISWGLWNITMYNNFMFISISARGSVLESFSHFLSLTSKSVFVKALSWPFKSSEVTQLKSSFLLSRRDFILWHSFVLCNMLLVTLSQRLC